MIFNNIIGDILYKLYLYIIITNIAISNKNRLHIGSRLHFTIINSIILMIASTKKLLKYFIFTAELSDFTLDDTAANQYISVVENNGLSRSYRPLRRIENDFRYFTFRQR